MSGPEVKLSAALTGRYTIERELGQGGMATVYLAHDVRHDRKVALKVLRPELSAILGADRFLAEIKTTANLQHPHILSLFDSGEADGLVFYVMPFVEGESLRDRLKREHQLPIEDAVRITREVADALEYAHRHGIVHRDIKPENILLQGGHALVADFGIALAAARSEGGTRLTETGMSLGTPHYMAPEQAMGEREITPKADIYALGCVTYEMLTAEPPFTGATAQAIIARVVTEEPRSLTLQRKTIPPHVEAAVRQALAKLPADRFGSAAEYAAALVNTAFATAGTGTASVARAAEPPSRRAVLFAWGAVAVVSLFSAWGWLRPRPTAPVARYAMVLRNDEPSGANLRSQAAIAPDGAFIVYRDGTPGNFRLYIKRRDELTPQPLSGTEGGTGPFVSPDGAWIGFFANGELRKIPSRGGGALTIADSVNMTFVTGTWLEDGTIVYSDLPDLRRVSAAGGPTTVIVPAAQLQGRVSLMPEHLPRGRGILLTACDANCARSSVYVYDARTDTARLLFEDALGSWYAPTGHVLHLTRNGTLLASPWDMGALAPSGPAVPVLDGIQAPGFLLAPDGTALYVLGPPTLGAGGEPNAEAVWVDRTGRVEQVDPKWRFNTGGGNWGFSLSPDGRRIAMRIGTALGQNVWIKQLPAGPVSRLTFHDGEDRAPYWTPDGRAITFTSDRPLPGDTARSNRDVWQQPSDGTGEPTLLWDHALPISEAFWSPDGRWLVMRTAGPAGATGQRDILAVRPGTDSVARRLIATRHDEQGVTVSPDSRWIAYVSNETGSNEVFIRPFPDVERGKWQVSNGGGNAPVWAHNGRELFYFSGGNLNVAEIRPGPPFSVTVPRALFPRPDRVRGGSSIGGRIAIAPDDQRFLLVRDVPVGGDSTATERLILVQNFFTELEAKVRP
jgi:serine/threonine-protein kinase